MEKNKEIDEITERKYTFKNKEDFQKALNQAPKESWVKKRNLGNKSSLYLPIQYQQALADIIFDEFDVIDAKFQQITNEILCTVTIRFLPSYPYAEHRTMSGTGAKPIQASSGSFVDRFPKGKIINSLEYCAPAARTAAISNALSSCGNVFGRNIGRAIEANYNLSENKKKKKNGKK